MGNQPTPEHLPIIFFTWAANCFLEQTEFLLGIKGFYPQLVTQEQK
jgi:hypothetical protein